MRNVKKAAVDWAERNSHPGAGGRDAAYEILIAVQVQSFEAGAAWQRERDAQLATIMQERDPEDDEDYGYIHGCEDVANAIREQDE
jgi:hypothetical protein